MTAAESDFSKVRFKSPEKPDRRWLEWFRDEFSRHAFKMDVDLDAEKPFRFEGIGRQLPGLSFYMGAASSMRTAPTLEAIHEGSVGLTVALQGDLAFSSRNDSLAIACGAIAFGRPNRLETRSDTQFLCVRLSSEMLAPLVPRLANLSLASLPADSQATRLLIGYLRMLNAEETIDTPQARHLVTTHVHDLAAFALGVSQDATEIVEQRGKRAARLAAVKADILDNLASPGLSVASVAARQDVTQRYVHMLFETEGESFSEFVVGQRLLRAHRMLGDPRLAHQTISVIALNVGFGDLSYFNRTFRRRYGMTPSDVRESARKRS